MNFVQLSTVQHRIRVGVPLPFHVRDADQTLLLARGQVVATAEQMSALFDRGALVDAAETAPPEAVQSPAAAAPPAASADARRPVARPAGTAVSATILAIRQARAEQLPALMRTAMSMTSRVLSEPPGEGFSAALEGVTEPLMAIVERDPDLAIFQILRQEGNYLTQYGVNHSIHCAITAFLVATRLGWSEAELRRTFKAALTMNISMLELQGELATQSTPITDDQRSRILSHPLRSMAMLEQAGITDADWLNAITLHHDEEGATTSELAALLRRADVYTAKLSPRSNRDALGADVAARMMFTTDRANPVTTAIVKEFGLYPPGCHVKLASGETGVVVRRGDQAHTPWVAATTNPAGMVLPKPLARNSSQRQFSISAVLRQGAAGMRFTPEVLLRACA